MTKHLEFSELNTSTRTVMVYTNIRFNPEQIFRSIYVTPLDPTSLPLTKKKKNVDKKRLKAPYGSIISLQKGHFIRGLDLRRGKKHWCAANCTPMEKKGDNMVKINTVVEELHTLHNDTKVIKYFCTECKRYYTLKQLGKITSFLNQTTIVISIENILLNIMMFKDNFKIAGCRSDTDASTAIELLWKHYISKVENGYTLTSGTEPRFVFQLVMRNVDFKLGFYVDRENLNRLMNEEKYSDLVYMSHCENTGQTNVNIKMYSKKPDDYQFDCLVFPDNEDFYYTKLSENPYNLKKRYKQNFTTFIVFSSSEIILSGRYESNMKKLYDFFIKEVGENKSFIEEKISEPGTDLLTHLRKMKK